ncbi:MAG TPA: NifB/NifX family molybdenum-iron cluster-binding protein [Prolixibacteraceae bacterium]|nr:NifB/NifX family molybdenum-iron cluster-binding protein [Prolixibacteraceae bacterium]
MKIAIPTRNNYVDNHFGHCELYTIFTIDETMQITATETLPSPQGCGCKSNIAAILKNHGVEVMLAGNMGSGALTILQQNGLKVYRGCSGDINGVVTSFLSGQVKDSGESCQHHSQKEEHDCSHA